MVDLPLPMMTLSSASDINSNMSSPLQPKDEIFSAANLHAGDVHDELSNSDHADGHAQVDSTTTATSGAFDSSDFSFSENESAAAHRAQAKRLSKVKTTRILSSVKELTHS